MTEETIINLDAVFNDTPAKAEKASQPDDTEQEDAGEVEGEKEGESPAPEKQEDEEKGHVPVKAVQEERRKRQAAEKAAEEAKAELQAYREKGDSRPDAVEDPEGALKHTETAIEKRLVDVQVNTSRNMMLALQDRFPDFLEKEQLFCDMAKANPTLVAEMRGNENPALFAYNKAKEHLDFQEFLASKDSPEFKEFFEAKKNGSLKESPSEKRNKSALGVPNLINTPSSKITKPVKATTLDDILSD